MYCVYCNSTTKLSNLSHKSYYSKFKNFFESDEFRNLKKEHPGLSYYKEERAKLKEFRDSHCQTKICLPCFAKLSTTLHPTCPTCNEKVSMTSFNTINVKSCVYCNAVEDILDSNTFMAKLLCGCKDTYVCFGCKQNSDKKHGPCPKCNNAATHCRIGTAHT